MSMQGMMRFRQVSKKKQSVPFTGTVIDSAWLTANGPEPYYLSADNETYRLGTNVTTARTAFAISGDNVTLDLNGYTITHGQDVTNQLANGDFTTDTSGWDLTGASSASRKADATYLGNTCYSGTTSLEIGMTGSGTSTVETTASVSLVAGEAYALGFWFEGSNLSVSVTIGANTSSVTRNKAGTFTLYHFVAASTESAPVEISFTDTSGSANTVYMDSVRFGPSLCHGIAVSVSGTTYTNGITAGGTNFTLIGQNGSKIAQGAGSLNSSNMMFREAAAFRVDGEIEFELHADSIMGSAGQCIHGGYATGDVTVTGGAKFDNQARAIRHRELFYGYNMWFGAHRANLYISNCVCVDGCHGFIYAQNDSGSGGNSAATYIGGNSGQFRGKYTNGFFIQFGAAGAGNTGDHYIVNNTMTVSEGYGGRFLHFDNQDLANTSTVTITGNTVSVRELQENQEYSGYVTGGSYGFEIETECHDVVIGNNSYTVTGSSGGKAMRHVLTGTGEASITSWDNETLIVDFDSFTNVGACFYPYGMDSDTLPEMDNWTFQTNDVLIYSDRENTGTTPFTWTNAHIYCVNDGSTRSPWRRGRYGAGTFKFVNATFEDAYSLSHLKQTADNDDATASEINVEFWDDITLTFLDTGSPVSCNVTIKDKDANIVFGPTATNGSGEISTSLKWFELLDDETSQTATELNPFSVETDYGGGTTDSYTLTTATKTTTFNL